MNSTKVLKQVTLELNENQLCLIVGAFANSRVFNPESSRSDVKELRELLQKAFKEIQ